MTASARKALRSVVQFSVNIWHRATTGAPPMTREREPVHRVGEFYADYSLPTRKEIEAAKPELDELFKHSKPISR